MNEIIFYNGFNLLVDIIVGAVVFYITARIYWAKGYSDGYADRTDHEDKAGHYFYDQAREHDYEGSK